MPMAARDVLLPALKLAVEKNDETAWLEIQGLLGRSAKQIFVGHVATTPRQATAYLEEALTAYRTAFIRNPSKAWYHGGNVAALLRRKSLLFGGPATAADDSAAFAEDLRKTCDAIPPEQRDYWWYATSAEVELGRGKYESFAEEVKKFLDEDGKRKLRTEPFAINSLLRQLREVWLLDSEETPAVARGTLALLSRALLQWSGPDERKEPLVVPADSVAAERTIDDATRDQLQKVFGDVGPMSVEWWELGLKRARSVAAIYGPGSMGPRRVGTGFLVKVKTCGGDNVGCFVLTNAHVIGDLDPKAIPYQEAIVRFEGHDPTTNFKIKSVPWASPITMLDATLLEIEGCPTDIEPIPITMTLPNAASERRLYIIGHAGGNELAFSFEDNQLLDHEGPPDGHPRRQGVILMHYRTPTMGGSSGSPVFVDNRWTAVGLHHSGSAVMQRLNCKPGTYQANEGIALSSISKALSSKNWELCT
jgi:hypothetical protein